MLLLLLLLAHPHPHPHTHHRQAYGIHFNSLLALNNMPIKRFADFLIRQGALAEYMQLLVSH
jgi:hypothetical protein